MSNMEIPYHLIRRNLKEVIENDVSKSYVYCVKEFLEEIMEKIAASTVQTLESENRIRAKVKLPEVRRIDDSIFMKVKANLLNYASDYFNGEIGGTNSNTILSKANVEVV